MKERIKDIVIVIEHESEVHEILTYEGEYRNLMTLIRDKIYVEPFGECGGMGRCGTCLVEVLNAPETLLQYERNEAMTIKKLGVAGTDLRLSCQIGIDKHVNNMRVRILAD